MNFVQQLEECLRDLAAEARKKHPGVKEASERATLKLRMLKNQYVSAVRKASSSTAASDGGQQHPTTQLFQQSDLLHPFLLAANYPNASQKLLDITFKAARLLMEAGAIVPTDGIHMVRVWMIQAQVVVSHYQKQFAKEIQAAEEEILLQQKQQQQQVGEMPTASIAATDKNDARHNNDGTDGTNAANTGLATSTTTATSNTSSSWFGWGSSSSSAATAASTSTVPSEGNSGSSSNKVKNAVSSSSGQTGTTTLSPQYMEKMALEILSCLLQLLELLRTDPGRVLENSTEIWTAAVALGCLWFHYVPAKHTVQQAARSTVSQVMSLLYSCHNKNKNTKESNDNANCSGDGEYNATHLALMQLTWQDLLELAEGDSHMPQQQQQNKKKRFVGAFALCKAPTSSLPSTTSTTPSVAPSSEYALELMTRLWKENEELRTNIVTAEPSLVSKTFTMTCTLLQRIHVNVVVVVEKSLRVTQWALSVLQTQLESNPVECRQLFLLLLQPIQSATESCRTHDDFEDGYVCTRSEVLSFYEQLSNGNNNNNSASTTTTITNPAASNATTDGSKEKRPLPLRLACFFPTTVLWKAALSLEAVRHVLELAHEDGMHVSFLLEDHTVVATVAETLSDFATIGASCQDHILQLVEYCHGMPADLELTTISTTSSSSRMSQINRIKPTVFHKAEQVVAAGIVFSDGGMSSTSSGMTKSADKASSTSSAAAQASALLGEALWMAFDGILRITAAIQNVPQESPEQLKQVEERAVEDDERKDQNVIRQEDLLEETFAPSLAVLQHYLKRFVGSDCLVQLALQGYTNIAAVCLMLPQNNAAVALQRKALLTSLCKLSLPAWGKLSADCCLQDHHVRGLLTLTRIVHAHYNTLSTAEWDFILWTLEELSVLRAASPLLSEEAYHSALAVAAMLGRLAPFSTCFEHGTLVHMYKALTDIGCQIMEQRTVIQNADTNTTVLPEKRSSVTSSSTNQNSVDVDTTTISEKIMNIGVRAIYGTSSSSVGVDGDTLETSSFPPHLAMAASATATADRKVCFYEEYCTDFVRRMDESKSTVRIESLGGGSSRRVPYTLILLADTAMANSFRHKTVGKTISAELSRLAASSPAVRPFAMDIMAMLVLSHLQGLEIPAPAPFGPARVVFEKNPMQSQLWAVESISPEKIETSKSGRGGQAPQRSNEQEGISQEEMLDPLCHLIQTTGQAAVAEAALAALTSILEGAGHCLQGNGVWSVLIRAITSLSGAPSSTENQPQLPGRALPEWSQCCLSAFRCLKFVVDDFLSELPIACTAATSSLGSEVSIKLTARALLLECCSSFGSSRHDVNTSLTAIGLLWTIADQGHDDSNGTASALIIETVLSKLATLSTDERTEVRNAAVNTLFSCVVGRGQDFSKTQWESCFSETIFSVYDVVAERAGGGANSHRPHANGEVVSAKEQQQSRYRVALHHSRDSTTKQWAATQVLVLRGLIRVLRNYFTQLLETTDRGVREQGSMDDNSFDEDVPWFQDAWVRIVDFGFEGASQGGGRETLDIRTVCVELLVVCCQLSSSAGIQAAITPARVGTNMEVINGALRNVRDATSPVAQQAPPPLSKLDKRSRSNSTEQSRRLLFLEAFESLESYQEFLDKSLADPQAPSDDARVQVLHKYCSGLAKLYDCCKESEFEVDNCARSLRSFTVWPPAKKDGNDQDNVEQDEDEDDHLEERFVSIVVAIMQGAAVGATSSRFLNQAQRCALDLLKKIASDGSSEAFMHLLVMASGALFVRGDSDAGDESEHFGEAGVPTYDLLNFEAAAALSGAVASDSLSDECRTLVLYKVLSKFIEDYDNDKEPRRRRYYKNLVPVLFRGLQAASRVEESAASDATGERAFAVGLVWGTLCRSLTQMLSLTPLGMDLMKISRAAELQEMMTAAIANVPTRYKAELCKILSLGASRSFEVARAHESFARAKSDGDTGRKSRRHRDDVLKLFTACFSGVCSLQPDDPLLAVIGKEVLNGALQLLTDGTDGAATRSHVCVEATVQVCEAIKLNRSMEGLVIALFPLMCKIVTSDNLNLQAAGGDVFATVDVTQVLEAAQHRYEDAERRATVAEEKVKELTAAVEELKQENESLRQEIQDGDSS